MTRVRPETPPDETMTPNVNKGQGLGGSVGSGQSLYGNSSSFINFEKLEPGGVQERLGAFNRISTLTILLLVTMSFLGLSGYFMLKISLYDIRWTNILREKEVFPNLSSTPDRSYPYFEDTKLQSTVLGKMMKAREDWLINGVHFGLARETEYTLPSSICLLSLLGLCVCHLLLSCALRRVRRKFQLISIGYSYLGLFTFTLCLTTLYYSFVHRVSAYLENSKLPPPAPEEDTDLFINLMLACAFAYSKPNVFTNTYPMNRTKAGGVSKVLAVNGSKYSKNDLMELGICPRQDYILLSVLLLGITSATCLLVASLTESMENQILGPPVWLQRFKVKVHKGIRQWETRAQVPTYVEGAADNADNEGRPRVQTHRDSWGDEIADEEIVDYFSFGDEAYSVLDGGVEHVIFGDPLNLKASKVRLHHQRHH